MVNTVRIRGYEMLINRDVDCMDLWCDSVKQAGRMMDWAAFLGLSSWLNGRMVAVWGRCE